MADDEHEDEGVLNFAEMDDFEGLVIDVPNGGMFHRLYAADQTGLGDRPQYGLAVPMDDLPPELHDQVLSYTPRHELLNGLGQMVNLRGPRAKAVPMTSGIMAWSEGEALRLFIARQGKAEADRHLRAAVRAAEVKLHELLQRLDARNLRRDSLFVGRRLRVDLRGLRLDRITLGSAWRHLDDAMVRRIDGKLKLMPQKVWVWIEEDE